MSRRKKSKTRPRRAKRVRTKPDLPSARPWLGLASVAILIAVGVIVYFNSFQGVFILDDLGAIIDNPHIRRLWPPWGLFSAPAETTAAGRPVYSLTLALNYALAGSKEYSLGSARNAWGYHAVNLGVHVLAAMALFGIVRRTLLSERLRERLGRASAPLALAAALMWMVHPLQTASVTYISQRAESLMGLMFLLTLYCAVRGFQARMGRWWLAAAAVCCAIGMGCKEVMAVAPLVVLLYDRTFASGSFGQALRRRRGFYAALAATWALLAALMATSERTQTVGFAVGVARPWNYAATQFGVIVHYLRLAFWPDSLCLDYWWPMARTARAIVPPAILVAGLLAATVWALWRKGAWGFLGAWFFLILAPTSSIVPIADAAFEHRMYLPLAAVVVLVVVGGYLLGGILLRRLLPSSMGSGKLPALLGAALVIAVVAALGVATTRRNQDYHDEIRMWQDVVKPENSPYNPRAHFNLGTALGRHRKFEQAERHLLRAVQLKPDYANAHHNLGNALAQRGKYVQAVESYEKALRLEPDHPKVRYNLGNALVGLGRPDQAMEHFKRAIQLRPDYARAHKRLADVLYAKGRYAEAVGHYRRSLRIRSDVSATDALAWLLATCPDDGVRNGTEAVELAERACRDTQYKQPRLLDTLAAAYAAAVRFPDAVRTAERAAALAEEAGRTAKRAGDLAAEAGWTRLAKRIRQRLKLYQAGRAFREGRIGS